MKVAIVDDDPQQRQLLKTLISEELSAYPYQHSLRSFDSGEAFLAQWPKNHYDLVVLDIYMGGMTGMDVAFRIREQDDQVMLAFCTSSNEFASESYEVGAQHYLRKPITKAAISRMFQRLNLQSYEEKRTIRLPDGHLVVLRNILYTDYENHVVTVHMRSGEPYTLRTRQSEIEELLLPSGFFCSPIKGVTVNFHAVRTMTDDTITLTDETQIPLSRRKAKEVREAYKKFCLDLIRKEVSSR